MASRAERRQIPPALRGIVELCDRISAEASVVTGATEVPDVEAWTRDEIAWLEAHPPRPPVQAAHEAALRVMRLHLELLDAEDAAAFRLATIGFSLALAQLDAEAGAVLASLQGITLHAGRYTAHD